MRREDLSELQSIQPIENVPSILSRGILSHRRAANVQHASVAAEEIQDRRMHVTVPGGRPLHEYANLYFHARHPMMSRIRSKHDRLCVLRIDTAVLDLDSVVVTDGNAASSQRYIRFSAAADGLDFIDEELVFAEWWTDPDTFEYWRKSRAKCAEVLVPERVPSDYIMGAYACRHGSAALVQVAPTLEVEVDDHMFFC